MQELKQNNHTNYVVINDGYNVCPKCGRPAYAVMTEDQMYRVGCLNCGLVHGVVTYIEDDLIEHIQETLRIRWNKRCLDSDEYSIESMEAMDVCEGDYVIVESKSKEIVCFIRSSEAMKQYVQENPDTAFDIYQFMCGQLQFMGCSYFANELLGHQTIRQQEALSHCEGLLLSLSPRFFR